MDSLQELIDFNNRTREVLDAQSNAVQAQTAQNNQAFQGREGQQQSGQQPSMPGLNTLSRMRPTGAAAAGGSSITAAPGVSLGSSGTALGSFEGLTATSGGAVSGGAAAGGGTAAGGTAAGGSAGGAGLTSLASFWPAAIVAAAIGNEWYSKAHGERRDGADYYKDLATGRVLQQDVDNRWSPMLFGKSDSTGLGHDMSVGADLGSLQVGKAFKDLKKSSLLTGFGIFK